LLGSTAVRAADVEVIHWWTSGGEQAAVSVFAREFDALGEDKWVDTAIAGGENARSATLQRILGGDPPGAAQFNPGRQYEELIAGGLLLDLTDLATSEGWADFIRPASISEACEVDGKMVVRARQHPLVELGLGLDPGVRKGRRRTADQLRGLPREGSQAAGSRRHPVRHRRRVVADQRRLRRDPDRSMLGLEKREQYPADRNLDVAVAEMPAVFEVPRKFKQFSDEGSANRNWNDTTNLVVTDQAGMQIMGDWARGEFGVAGEKPGVDYACLALPIDSPTVSTGGDIFLFPKQSDPAVEAAQLKMASMMVNPQVQALFNNAKGSMPIRDDVDMSLADDCMKRGLEIIGNEANIAVDAGRWQSNDTTGQMNDLVSQFWADDSMTAEAATEQYVAILENAD
jgi:glucose/mannose transport system substrate-binding protein